MHKTRLITNRSGHISKVIYDLICWGWNIEAFLILESFLEMD
jgi:hypothetical protein